MGILTPFCRYVNVVRSVTLAKSVLVTLKIAERDILQLVRLVICTRVKWEAEVNVELAKLKRALSKYIASGHSL